MDFDKDLSRCKRDKSCPKSLFKSEISFQMETDYFQMETNFGNNK